MSASKLTPEATEAICKLVAEGHYRDVAAASAGIAGRTLKIWVRKGVNDEQAGKKTKYTRFVADLQRAELHGEQFMLDQATVAGADDWKFWFERLKHKFPKRYGLKANISLTIERDRNRMLDVVQELLTPELFEKVLQALTATEAMSDDTGDPVEEVAGENAG